MPSPFPLASCRAGPDLLLTNDIAWFMAAIGQR